MKKTLIAILLVKSLFIFGQSSSVFLLNGNNWSSSNTQVLYDKARNKYAVHEEENAKFTNNSFVISKYNSQNTLLYRKEFSNWGIRRIFMAEDELVVSGYTYLFRISPEGMVLHSNYFTGPVLADLHENKIYTAEEREDSISHKVSVVLSGMNFITEITQEINTLFFEGERGNLLLSDFRVSTDGSFFITGRFKGRLENVENGKLSFFLLKANAQGKVEWIKTSDESLVKSDVPSKGKSLFIHNNEVWVSISGHSSPLKIDDQYAEAKGFDDVFLARFDKDGICSLIREIGSSGSVIPTALSGTDDGSHLFLTGYSDSPTCFDTQYFFKEKKTTGFVAMFDGSGNFLSVDYPLFQDNTSSSGAMMTSVSVFENKVLFGGIYSGSGINLEGINLDESYPPRGFMAEKSLELSSVKPEMQEGNLKIFPNPSTSVLNLFNPFQEGKMKIFTLLGQEVWHIGIKTGQSEIFIGLLEKGTYILRFECAEITHIQKLILN